tara:strand:+ start:315 stop:869 length:555 start_codon:yes stop_codon:yes gene_type:complete
MFKWLQKSDCKEDVATIEGASSATRSLCGPDDLSQISEALRTYIRKDTEWFSKRLPMDMAMFFLYETATSEKGWECRMFCPAIFGKSTFIKEAASGKEPPYISLGSVVFPATPTSHELELLLSKVTELLEKVWNGFMEDKTRKDAIILKEKPTAPFDPMDFAGGTCVMPMPRELAAGVGLCSAA